MGSKKKMRALHVLVAYAFRRDKNFSNSVLKQEKQNKQKKPTRYSLGLGRKGFPAAFSHIDFFLFLSKIHFY